MASGSGGSGRKKADVVMSVNVNLSAEGGQGEDERRKVDGWFQEAARGFRIADWGLFGDSED